MAKRGGFPGGMPGNMSNLMKQAQRMQRQMEESQKELETKEFVAKAGGGAVEVTVTGKKEIAKVKLSEEVGELSRAMRKGLRAADKGEISGTVDEEVWDVMYYAIAIANLYGVDLERVIQVKSEISQSKYPSAIVFEENR